MRNTDKIAIQAAADFMNFCNGASKSQMEAFAVEVTSDHRTIQQTAFTTMMRCVQNWAEMEHNGRYDERNRMTCLSSKQIACQLDVNTNPQAPLFDNGELLGLPYI